MPDQIEIIRLLSLLRPSDIDVGKIRLGPRHDGGYVVADLSRRGTVLSFGVGGTVEFERDLADRGHPTVHLFDHTVPGLPQRHKSFRFHKQGICAAGQSIPDTQSLEAHIHDWVPDTQGMLLKIDVEGHEWGVFANSPPDLLDCFDQIIVEVHWLSQLSTPGFAAQCIVALSNLAANFTLFHVHGNNHCPLSLANGFVIPDVLELSYVRTSLVSARTSATLYPTEFDNANERSRPDYALLFYPFMPDAVDAGAARQLVEQLTSKVVVDEAR